MKPAERKPAWLWRLITKREAVIGINRRNVGLVYPYNKRTDYPLADDKLLSKIRLQEAGIPTPEVLAICSAIYEVPEIVSALRTESDFVLKPARGSGGDGILVVGEALAAGGWRRGRDRVIDEEELFRHLADIVFGAFSKDLEDRAFIERKIVADPVLGGLSDDGLSDLRIISLEGRLLRAMLRVPTQTSGGRANLHQGGVGLAVRLDNGEIFRALCKGDLLTHHPDSGAPLLGLKIPRWQEILEIARQTAAAFPLGFLGLDLVLDETRGPLVLEINARPGLEIQNVHGLGMGSELAESLA